MLSLRCGFILAIDVLGSLSFMYMLEVSFKPCKELLSFTLKQNTLYMLEVSFVKNLY